MRTGKIARLPHQIRQQINTRLRDHQQAAPILKWLNALPEVKAIIKAEFDGHPITKQNLSEWRNGGFRDWLLLLEATDFFTSFDDTSSSSGAGVSPAHDQPPTPPASILTQKLLFWLLLQYAVRAKSIAADADPRSQWHRLRELCSDITRLRRSDLYAEYLTIQRNWLEHEKSHTEEKKQKQFRAWAKKPEIMEELLGKEPGGLTDEAVREITTKLKLL
jgi:hypothetical protein